MKQNLTVVIGPTASGKTAHAIALAKKCGGAVISADSRQLYTGMNIGTAKPPALTQEFPHDPLTPDIVEEVPHYLFNVATPDNPLTLAQWQNLAFTVIEHLHANNQPPILAGGTMLYVDSIVKNYAIPEVPPNPSLRRKLEKESGDDLYTELIEKDPNAQKFIESHHKQRIIRALEVIDTTGKTFSEQRVSKPLPYDTTVVGLFPGWEVLRRNIETRSKSMFAEGLLKETEKLVSVYGEDLPLLQTLGYKQAIAANNGSMSEKEAVDDLTSATNKYARRQMSWWRGRDEIEWLSK